MSKFDLSIDLLTENDFDEFGLGEGFQVLFAVLTATNAAAHPGIGVKAKARWGWDGTG